jgi:hypothetical protein
MPEIVSTARYAWRRGIDYRAHPELYRVGRGEQGVLTCEPYKSEILPHWRFRTPPIAARSARKILELFEDYLKNDDFVGADMARKFLQMGYTRSRRYANYKGGGANTAAVGLYRWPGGPAIRKRQKPPRFSMRHGRRRRAMVDTGYNGARGPPGMHVDDPRARADN